MPTTPHVLTQAWTEIATAPLAAEVKSGTALIHFGAVAPAEDTLAYHIVPSHQPNNCISHGGTEKMFAKRGQIECNLVVTETGS